MDANTSITLISWIAMTCSALFPAGTASALSSAFTARSATVFVVERSRGRQDSSFVLKSENHRLKAVAPVTGCKPYFRPEAGRMIPAPETFVGKDVLPIRRHLGEAVASREPAGPHIPGHAGWIAWQASQLLLAFRLS